MTWIEKEIHAIGVRALLCAVVIVIMLMIAYKANARYLSCFFKGAQVIEKSDLDAVYDVAKLKRYWVTLNVDALTPANYQEVTTYESRYGNGTTGVTGTYYIAHLGDKLLAVKMRYDERGLPVVMGNTVTGVLLPSVDDHDDAFFKNSTAAKAQIAQFYPGMILDTRDFRSGAAYLFLAIGAAALATALWLAWIGLMWMNNPRNQKPYTDAESWGNLTQISKAIETELAKRQAITAGHATFTSDYVVLRRLYSFRLLRIGDLTGVHQSITKTRNRLRTITRHALSLGTDEGSVVIHDSDNAIGRVMTKLGAKRPEIILGASNDLSVESSVRHQQLLAEATAMKYKALNKGKDVLPR